MKWSVFFTIILVVCYLLVSAQNNTIKGGERVELEEDIQEVFKIIKQYENGKYVLLDVTEGEQNKKIIFNTEEGRIDHDFAARLPENRYQVNIEQDGSLKVIDNTHDQLILERNLIHDDAFSTVKDLWIQWSNTGKYLFIKQARFRNYFLYDVEENKKIDNPFEGTIRIVWSDDDKIAFVSNNKSSEIRRNTGYIWNIEEDILEKIRNMIDAKFLKWSPDNNLYAVDLTLIEDKYYYRVSRYSIEEKQWLDLYKIDIPLNKDSFKIINENEFVFAATGTNPTRNPLHAFMRPQQDYVVKVNHAKDMEIIKKIDSYLPKVRFWSFDNQYLYYQDRKGFFKAKVNF